MQPPSRPSGKQAILPSGVCLICDGPASSAVMAAYAVQQMPLGFQRKDLSLVEAVHYFKSTPEVQFDHILVAPDVTKLASRQALHLVLTLAAVYTSSLRVLLPIGAELPLPAIETMEVLYGPPFLAPVVAVPESEGGAEGGEPSLASSTEPAQSWIRLLLPKALRSKSKSMQVGVEQSQNKTPEPVVEDVPYWTKWGTDGRKVIAIQPLVGGAGASLLTANLAAELVRLQSDLQVCILDLNVQFGNIATYFDLTGDNRVMEAYRNLKMVDGDVFQACLQLACPGVSVFPAPAEIVPIDGMGEQDVRRLITLAKEVAPVVLIDLPHLISDWSEAIFTESDLVLGVCVLEARCAQNAVKLRNLLQGAGASNKVHVDKIDYVLNRAASKPVPLQQRAYEEFEKGLGRRFVHQVLDGGVVVTEAANLGQALQQAVPYNPARKSIAALARNIFAHLPQNSPQK